MAAPSSVDMSFGKKSTLTPEELNRRIQSTRRREDVTDASERHTRMAKQRGMARTEKILESD